MRRFWLPHELAMMRAQYPHMQTKIIAAMLGRTLSTVYQRAAALGLVKSQEFYASPASGRTCGRQGIGTRFVKGQMSWNKGTHYNPGGRSVATRFQPGVRRGVAMKLYKPIGTERVSKDGYLERKVNDGMPLQRRWRAVHLIEWEAVNGPLSRGYAIRFKDGDKANRSLDNLECISRADLMRRNSFHRYPQPIPQLIQLRGALQRQINRREGNGKQDRGSSGTPVRNAGEPPGQGRPDGHRAGEGGRGSGEGDRG